MHYTNTAPAFYLQRLIVDRFARKVPRPPDYFRTTKQFHRLTRSAPPLAPVWAALLLALWAAPLAPAWAAPALPVLFPELVLLKARTAENMALGLLSQ